MDTDGACEVASHGNDSLSVLPLNAAMPDGAPTQPSPTASHASGDDRAEAVATLVAGMRETLRVARALVAARRCVDLAGLDGLAGSLCAQVLDLPPDQGRAMRLTLLSLQAEADALLAALREQADDTHGAP